MGIPLSAILQLPHDPSEYKVHLACWNQKDQPLDVFVRSKTEWEGWNRYRGVRDDFNRPYIFSLIDFYPEPHTWLFGGIFQVDSRWPDRYDVSLGPHSNELVGRLKVLLERPGRARSVTLERYFEQIVVSEILREQYSGEDFCGYENINYAFDVLEQIIKQSRPDWRAALQNIKGVYLITDKSNGKRYVGSAYGETGLWSRWSSYIQTGHGGTDELTRLIRYRGLGYARKNLTFTLLEYRAMKTDDHTIIERESFWKKALLTTGEFGYNKN